MHARGMIERYRDDQSGDCSTKRDYGCLVRVRCRGDGIWASGDRGPQSISPVAKCTRLTGRNMHPSDRLARKSFREPRVDPLGQRKAVTAAS
jgi:hypothetical protein